MAKSTEMSPREYWAFAFNSPDGNASKEKREDPVSPREYWAFAFKTRDGNPEKRAEVKGGTLETNCEQAAEGVYCTYTNADIEAFGSSGTKLETYCIQTTEGVSCFYPSNILAVCIFTHSKHS